MVAGDPGAPGAAAIVLVEKEQDTDTEIVLEDIPVLDAMKNVTAAT